MPLQLEMDFNNDGGDVSVAHTLRWQDNYAGSSINVTYELNTNPQLTYSGLLTYESPAIDALPTSESSINIDCYLTDRPQLCDKDMGVEEYKVANRNLEWDPLAERYLAPGEIYTYTFAVTNLSEQWHPGRSGDPGTGYTETLVLNLDTSRGWAEITDIVGEVSISENVLTNCYH